MASHAVRKAAHALSEEGDLLNVHAELKDVANAFDQRLKLQERATKTLLNWASRKKEDRAITGFLESMAEIETDSMGTERRYNDSFRVFVKLWKSVLAEKKELNSKVAAFKKAQKNVEQARKKLLTVETKQPRDEEKYQKAKNALESMLSATEDVRQAMEDKILDAQQEKHNSLRNGYQELYDAGMTRLRELIEAHRRLRDAVNSFPAVEKRNEDGSFEFAAFPDEIEEVPIWCRGEEIDEELRILKHKYGEDMNKLRTQHAEEMRKLLHERDTTELTKDESYNAEIVGLVQKHKASMDSLQAQHQSEISALEQQRAEMIAEQDKAVADLKKKIKHLEKHIAKQQRSIAEHVKEENRLEDLLEGRKQDLITQANARSIQSIENADTCLARPCTTFLFEKLRDMMHFFDALASSCEPHIDTKDYADACAKFADICSITAMAAWAMAKSSQAENSSDLLEAVKDLSGVAVKALSMRHAEKSSSDEQTDTVEEVSKAGKPLQRLQSQTGSSMKCSIPCVAIYDHPAKVQGGFNMIGFKKGDKMTVIKTREDGWSKVQNGEDKGWAPTSYLKIENKLDDIVEDQDAEDEDDTTSEAKEQDTTQLFSPQDVRNELETVIRKVQEVAKSIEARDRKLALLANALVDNIGSKVTAAQQAVLDANQRLAKIRDESNAASKGRRLEVNTNLLDNTEKLFGLMQSILDAADAMRGALEETKGMQSDEEFNSKHASWFEGVTQAVDAVVEGNPILMESLIAVVRQQGKHEEVQVAGRNISAAVARLAALSRNKQMPSKDTTQERLNRLCEEFISVSHEVLASARECHELDLASVMLENFNELSENEAKRLMMATQVHVLKLERELENEHEKLRRLRRMVNAGDD